MRRACAISVLLAVAACSEVSDHRAVSTEERFGYLLWQADPETGCQYIVTKTGGITPRLGADGRPICGQVTR